LKFEFGIEKKIIEKKKREMGKHWYGAFGAEFGPSYSARQGRGELGADRWCRTIGALPRLCV
jgi:hypothetical protein